MDTDYILRHEYKYDMREINDMIVWERIRILKLIELSNKEEADRLRRENREA